MGLLYKGVYMGYPYPNFCLCAFLGPYDVCFVSRVAWIDVVNAALACLKTVISQEPMGIRPIRALLQVLQVRIVPLLQIC